MKKIMLGSVVVVGFLLSYLLVFNGDNFNDISKYKVNVLNEASLNEMFEFLDSNEILESYSNTEKEIRVIVDGNQFFSLGTAEKDAAVLYSLIGNLESVVYVYNDIEYVISKESIEKIFNDISLVKPSKIYDRYKVKYFTSEDITYHGNIDGEYDLFDEATFCSKEKEIVDEDENFKYLISCTQINYLYIVDKKGNKTPLTEALGSEIINGKDLEQTNLDLDKEPINEDSN